LASQELFFTRSRDGGVTFDAPKVVSSRPQTIALAATNTSIGSLSTDGHGHLYVTYGYTVGPTTVTEQQLTPINAIAVSVSDDYGASWQDFDVNPGFSDANYGNFWMASAVDSAGHVFA